MLRFGHVSAGSAQTMETKNGRDIRARLCVGNGSNTVSESTVSNTELSEFSCPHRVPGRELSEFLSAYYLCAKANSPSFSQNSPTLPQNSVPDPPILAFFDFLAFFLFRFSLLFCAFFLSFPRILGVPRREKPLFFGGKTPCFFQKSKDWRVRGEAQ